MPNDCFNFSGAASRNAKALLGTALLLLAPHRIAFGAPEAAPSLPEAPVAEVSRNANGSQYQIGDRITLEARVPPGLLEAGDSIQISEESGKESPQWLLDPHPERVQGAVRFMVAPIQTGDLELPKFSIIREGHGPVAVTGPYRISVSGPAVDPSRTPELLSVVEIRLSWFHRILLLLAILTLGAIGFLLYKRLRNRRTVPVAPPVPSAPKETPDEVAIRRIELLFKENPYSTRNMKPVCFGCSEILKDFFSARFGVEASESTTREMLSLLGGAGLDRESLREVETLFTTLDLVKFTREENFAHLNEVDFSSVRSGALQIIGRWRPNPSGEAARS